MDAYEVWIDMAVVAGAALVLPAALPAGRRAWPVVAACSAAALALSPSPWAGVLAAPWVLVALWVVAHAAGGAWDDLRGGLLPSPDARLLAAGSVALAAWAAVAGIALVDTAVGRSWLGFGEPILRLTVVHFTFAGVGATALALAALQQRATAVRAAGLVLVVVAPPIVGLGFSTGAAVAQIGGPLLMAAGVYLVAAATVGDGWVARREARGALLLVSGLAVWVPMVLAVAWALAPHTGGPSLSVPDMVRLHGGAQALGFVGCGLLGRRLDLPVVRWGGLGAARVDELLVAARSAEPTSGALVVGQHEPPVAGGFVRERVVGHGPVAFAAAVHAIRTLAPQREVAEVFPSEVQVAEGETLLVVLRFGPATLVAANRVAWVVSESGRWGFAYATLPGHPEQGQESFVVTREPDGSVVATIAAVARAAVPFGRWTGPLARPVQQRFADRYLEVIAASVARAEADDAQVTAGSR